MTETRPAAARVGIAALNILAPGLGLLKLGVWRLGVAVYGIYAAVALFLYAGPTAPFAVLLSLFVIGVAAYVVAIILSWRFSRSRQRRHPWYSQWWAVIAAVLIAFAISFVLTGDARNYRGFYIPSEAMTPTLPKGARFIAHMGRPANLRRGDLVLIRTDRGDVWIKRIVGLPGDRVGLVAGVIRVNGRVIRQRPVGASEISDGIVVRRLAEQFPGETKAHYIYDEGTSIGDDFGEVQISPGHAFVLGDNRDRSADSRFSTEMMGLDQVPLSRVIGRPLFHHVGSSKPLGTPLS
ncbi:MAG: signal peptidase I [Sphingomicrobium sp.]